MTFDAEHGVSEVCSFNFDRFINQGGLSLKMKLLKYNGIVNDGEIKRFVIISVFIEYFNDNLFTKTIYKTYPKEEAI